MTDYDDKFFDRAKKQRELEKLQEDMKFQERREKNKQRVEDVNARFLAQHISEIDLARAKEEQKRQEREQREQNVWQQQAEDSEYLKTHPLH